MHVGGAVIGAAIGIASTIINNYIDGKDVTWTDIVSGSLKGGLTGAMAGGFATGGVVLKAVGVGINTVTAFVSSLASDGSFFDATASALSAATSTTLGYVFPVLGSEVSPIIRTTYTAISGALSGGITESLSSCVRAVFQPNRPKQNNPVNSAKGTRPPR